MVSGSRDNPPPSYPGRANFSLIPRDAPVGHRRGNNPVEYVIFFLFFFLLLVVTKSNVEY